MRKRLKNTNQEKIVYNNGIYYGEVKNGKANGLGILEIDNHTKTEGEFFNGKGDGIIIEYSDIGIYMGESKNGLSNGFGIKKFKTGLIYEGDQLNGYHTGIGITTYEDGVIYIGQTKEGLPNGAGKFMWPNGDYFIGVVDYNGRKGLTFYAQELGIFDGEFKYYEDMVVGFGTFYFQNGRQEKRKRVIKGVKQNGNIYNFYYEHYN